MPEFPVIYITVFRVFEFGFWRLFISFLSYLITLALDRFSFWSFEVANSSLLGIALLLTIQQVDN